jgi:DNA-binding NtrC family response regulator
MPGSSRQWVTAYAQGRLVQMLLVDPAGLWPEFGLDAEMMQIVRRPSILYFDDEETCREAFRQKLGTDFDVRAVATLAEVRRALAEAAFDLIVSDFNMPEIDGLTFLRETAATQPDSYRVLLTGRSALTQFFGVLGAGVIHGFIPKPCRTEDIQRVWARADAASMRSTSGSAWV